MDATTPDLFGLVDLTLADAADAFARGVTSEVLKQAFLGRIVTLSSS